MKYSKIIEEANFASLSDTSGMGDVNPPLPVGVDAAKPSDFGSGDKFDSITPSLFKRSDQKKGISSQRSMTFEDFLKSINYQTHDSVPPTGMEPIRKRTGDI